MQQITQLWIIETLEALGSSQSYFGCTSRGIRFLDCQEWRFKLIFYFRLNYRLKTVLMH